MAVPAGTVCLRVRATAVAVCVVVVSGAARAQQQDDPITPLHFAFATQLGSGIYTTNGRTVQIYRIPMSWTMRESEHRRVGVKLTFPLTLGFFDFKTRDILEGDLPDRFGTISLVPGAEFEIPILQNWALTPFGEAGYVTDSESDGSAWAYAGGIRSLALFPMKSHWYRLGNVLKYVGFTETEDSRSEGYVELDTGLELRHWAGFRMKKEEVSIGYFFIDYFFVNGFEFKGLDGQDITIDNQIELGVTMGTEHRIKIWKFPVPRFGVSYRFGGNINTVRFVLGIPF